MLKNLVVSDFFCTFASELIKIKQNEAKIYKAY